MRLLIATAHRNIVGGVEKYLQKLLPCLVARGYEVALLYEFAFDEAKERIDAPQLDLACCGTEECGIDAGVRFAHHWRPDVVYSHGLHNPALQSALLSQYPVVLYAHNYVGTCVSEEKCHAFPAPQPCDRRFGPACLGLYHVRRCGGLHPGTMFQLYRRTAQKNSQLPQFAAVLVASAHMRHEFERHGVAPERVQVAALPNPEETAETFAQRSLESPPRRNLLFLGRLTKLKGGAELLRAMPLAGKKLRAPLSLTVAGVGPERERLEQFARRNSLNANFTGWIGSAQKSAWLEQSDLLVVPSLWPEPFGLVGIEAGVRGIPAVAFDVGGISDWLISGYSGELAPGHPPTVEGLADAIVRALSDESHYEQLRRGAREMASRFSLAAHVSKLESTLWSVLKKPQGEKFLHREEAVHADD